MIYLSNRNGSGETDEEGHYRLQTRMIQGNVLLNDDLKVIQNSPTGMSVLVSAGDYRIPTGNYAYTGWLDAAETVAIAAADPANPRITSIVLYVDKGAPTSDALSNNPGITKLAAVNGTAAGSPTAPNNAAILAVVGTGNPYIVLANVAVAAAATQIVTANITDLRVKIEVIPELVNNEAVVGAIGPALYPVGSVYINASVATNPATLLGFGTWTAFGAGRVPVGIDATQTEFDTAGETGGAKTHALSIAELATHNHAPGTIQVRANVGNVAAGAGNLDDFPGSDGPISATNQVVGNSVTGTTANTGSGTAHNNLQPYIVVYMWQRTA